MTSPFRTMADPVNVTIDASIGYCYWLSSRSEVRIVEFATDGMRTGPYIQGHASTWHAALSSVASRGYLPIPVDPMTALSMGMVTQHEIMEDTPHLTPEIAALIGLLKP